ncbi:MAG: heparan-alpha-glucosaminide N-acetyltransferase [Candidatus Syntropharchaeia archaeon]
MMNETEARAVKRLSELYEELLYSLKEGRFEGEVWAESIPKILLLKECRFWEIDSFRGLAILMMILFHLVYDLNYFAMSSFDLYSGFWWGFARATASIFVFLVGVSLTLSYSRRKRNLNNLYYLKRGSKIFGWGLIITMVTWIFSRESFIIFGVLHFIGISIVLSLPFLRFRFRNLFLGILLIIAGFYIKNLFFHSYWLIWLGIHPPRFYTLDYFPLLPWFGVVLIGLFFGNSFYPGGKRWFSLPDLSNLFPLKTLSFLGRHSLFIYLVHQPILIALVLMFKL